MKKLDENGRGYGITLGILSIGFMLGVGVVVTTGSLPGAVGKKTNLVALPGAPASIERRVPAKVDLRLVAREGTSIETVGSGLTLSGGNPGPTIRVFEGDVVEIEFTNHGDNQSDYTLVFQTSPDPESVVSSSATRPGDRTGISFTAAHAGLFLYHAVGTGEAVGGGVYGLMLVEPTYGFRRADREYFVVMGSGEQDGKTEAVVFNGRADAMRGDDALAAEPGERVRLFVGNAAPGLASTLRVTGPVEDLSVYRDGRNFSLTDAAVALEAGETAMIELDLAGVGEVEIVAEMQESGIPGPRGLIRIEEAVEVVEEPDTAPLAGDAAETVAMTAELKEGIAAGKAVYARTCIACHQATGLGIPGVYPPLAKSDYLIADLDRSIRGVIKGQQGEITVNGATYNMLMPPQPLSDEEIAQVFTYTLNSWGNPGGHIASDRVRDIRAAD